jgi:hypothetical protein
VELSLALTGDSKGKDTLKGVKMNDTALPALFIGPQVQLDLHRNRSLSMAVNFSLFQHKTSFQAVESWDAAAGLARHV